MGKKLSDQQAADYYYQNEKIRQETRNSILEEFVLAENFENEDGSFGREVNTQKINDYAYILEELPYSFAELGYNQRYVQLLKEKYKFETGKEFKGAGKDIKHLIDEDFADWNFVMNNIMIGMGSELLSNLAFKSDAERANALARWQIFNETSPFDSAGVDDSRPFLQLKFQGDFDPDDEAAIERAKDIGWNGFEVTGQLGDFIKGAGVDPLAWLTFGTGAGFMTRELIEKGVSTWLAPKVSLVTAGATYGGMHDVGRQHIGITAGSGDKYDPVKTLKHMGLAAAVTPVIWGAGKLMGPVGRVLTHPKQTFDKTVSLFAGSKSEMAAAQGVMQQAEQKLLQTGAVAGAEGETIGMSGVAKSLQDHLKVAYNTMDNYFNVMFDQVRSAPIKEGSITGLVERWNARFPKYELSESWHQLWDDYVAGQAAKGIPHSQFKEVAVLDLARQLRKEFYAAHLNDKKNFGGRNTELMGSYTHTINNIINKGIKKGNPELAQKLDKSYSSYKQIIEKSKYGKDLLAMAYDESTQSVQKLVQNMLDKKFSWGNFNQAIKHFEKLDHIVGNKGNQLTSGLRNKIEKAAAQYLVEVEGGANLITQLLRTVDGRKTIMKMFPSMQKEFNDIAYMSKHLGNWGGAESVIGNMAIARLGAMTGQQISPKSGGIWGGLLGITGWNKLMNSQYFKDAMVHAYKNNEGTMSTGTRNWLQKTFKGQDGKGLTLPQINQLQDTMWGFVYAGYALHGEDVLAERTESKYKDMLGDLKVKYQSTFQEGYINY